MQDKECKGYLLMLDIDDFKTVNDTMGHAIGDLALITLVKLLKEHFRREDIVGRLGGDEFIVFMTNTELASAVEAKGAEILDILAKSETTPHFTVSIGRRLILQLETTMKACIWRRITQCMLQRNPVRTEFM